MSGGSPDTGGGPTHEVTRNAAEAVSHDTIILPDEYYVLVDEPADPRDTMLAFTETRTLLGPDAPPPSNKTVTVKPGPDWGIVYQKSPDNIAIFQVSYWAVRVNDLSDTVTLTLKRSASELVILDDLPVIALLRDVRNAPRQKIPTGSLFHYVPHLPETGDPDLDYGAVDYENIAVTELTVG